MYYIYHIPGVKIGCSTEPDKRVKDQGYFNYEILEEHKCIYEVSRREIELQKEYGYKVDNVLYWMSRQNRFKWNDNTRHKFTKEDLIQGGKISGQKNVETRHIKKLGKKYGSKNIKYTRKKIKCEICGVESATYNYSRFHGNNCKHELIIKLFNTLPNFFTLKEAKEINKSINLPYNIVRKLVLDNYMNLILIVKKGLNGSNKNVTIYKKRAS